MAPSARKSRFYLYHFLLAGGLALLGTVLLWFALSQVMDWPHWLGCWLFAVNAVSFGYYGYDKSRAQGKKTRVPEVVLYTLTAVGGSIGSYLGMRVFRHKTVKEKFQIFFWSIVVLQVLIALWIAQRLWWSS